MDSNASQPTAVIIRDFELTSIDDGPAPTEEEVFQLLCDRISWLIEHNMGYLLSLLYRNDVLERHINEALRPDNPDPANIALAKLVMERQRQRLATKKQYGSQRSGEVDEDLRW